MQDYRVFVINSDGHVIDRFEFWCLDDDEAKEKARQLLDGQDIELWHQAQVVNRIPSKSGRRRKDPGEKSPGRRPGGTRIFPLLNTLSTSTSDNS